MENASKALLIAGGVLLTIIILSVIMLMYNNMSNAQRELENQKITAQFSKINEQIEVFTSSKTIYGSELLSLCNLLSDYKGKYPHSEGYPEINMSINLGSGITNWNEMKGKKTYTQIIYEYKTKEKAVNVDGKKIIKTTNNKVIGTVELLSGIRDNELELYVRNAGEVEDQINETVNRINVETQQYRNNYSFITTFKNKKFLREEVSYDNNTNIIYFIKYKMG